MDHTKKTKEQLINEIEELKSRVLDLENKSESMYSDSELMESEKRFKLLFENAPLSYQSLDENANLIDVNPAWLSVLGYKREEVIGRFFGDFMTPESAQKIKTLFSEFVSAGEIHDYQFEMVKKDGTKITVSYDGKIGYDEFGHFKQTHCIFADISDRIQMVKDIESSHARLKALFESSHSVIMFSLDDQYRYVAFNDLHKKEMKTIYDVDITEGINMLDLINIPEVKVIVENNFTKVLKGEYFEEIQSQPNTDITYQFYWNPVTIDDGSIIGISCLIFDISQSVKIQGKLKESEKKFRNLLQSTPLPIVHLNQDGLFTFRNDRFIKTFGYTETEVPGINEWWQRAYPDEKYRQWVIQNWESMVVKASETGEDIESDVYKVTCYDGTVRDVIISGIIMGDDLIVTLIDITELKEYQNKLVLEKEYSEEVINALPGLFYQISTENKFENWNNNFVNVSGYSEEEMGMISPLDLFKGEDKRFIAKSIEHVFSHGNATAEANLTSKDGEKTPYFFSGKEVLINEIPFLLGMGIDISELKEAENKLKDHQRNLESLVKERTTELESKNIELNNALKVFVGRELTIKNLQSQIRALKGEV